MIRNKGLVNNKQPSGTTAGLGVKLGRGTECQSERSRRQNEEPTPQQKK